MCAGLCVLWEAVGIREINIFGNVGRRQTVWELFFCLSFLARRPQKQLYPHEPARPEVRSGQVQGRW